MVLLISNQSQRVPVAVFAAVATMAVIAANRLPIWPVVLWFCVALVVLVSRYYVLRALPSRNGLTPVQRLNLMVRLNVIGGLIHACALLAFPLLPEAEKAFLSLLLMGLCTGAVATSAGYRPALLAYISPIVGGMALMWGLSPGAAEPSLVERVIALLLLFYGTILLGLGREVNRGITEAWAIGLRERHLNVKLQAALEIAENASRAKTRFLAAASHDLRQPLHTITMLGAALSMRPADTRGKEIIDLLNEVTESFSEQLDGLLDISKLDAGVITADRKPVRIADLITQHMAEIEGLILAKQLKPILICQSNDYAETDPLLFLRIVRNLTHNAIKFTDKGTISLEVRRDDNDVQVVVSDSGRGIPLEQQEQVFQEFYQIGNPERDRAQGLGLGLSIVRRLVDLLGIGMRMHSSPSGGTKFVLNLPVVHAPSGLSALKSVELPQQQFDLCVLLVDDEKNVRTSLRILLEELGCRCMEASGTLQAVQQVRHVRPDLVLADFRLRGNDSGISTIQAVHERWPAVPAVLVSGDTAPTRLQEAQYAGIRLLHKPLPLDVLRQELAAARSRQQKS